MIAAAVIAAIIWTGTGERLTERPESERGRVAVEAAAVTTGTIRDHRELTGTLEPDHAFTVAPKISGRIERIHADIGDIVARGSLLVELDDDEARQSVAEAEAMLSVARAEHEQAGNEAELAEREFERTRTLAARDLASQSELDAARARAAAERSAVAVAEARVREREASLQAARVRLSYTEVRANWPEGGAIRVIGERMVSTGDTVAANAALLSVLAIDPLRAVVFAPERDYTVLRAGQDAEIRVDARPGQSFEGRVARLAPRFDPASRQARVEIEVPNPDTLLHPGMFVTVRVEVGHVDDATLVPSEAIVRRDGRYGVYRIEDGDPPLARFIPVRVGIEGDDLVEVVEPVLDGYVVTLGQQLLEDGTPLRVATRRQ